MKTSFLLAGLLLAAPLSAQTDNVQELKAAELLRLSAEKAAAGHETAAAELAEKAMHMLRAEADKHRAQAEAKRVEAEARAVAEHAQALAQLGYLGETQEPKAKAKVETRGIMIVDGPNGREVIEFAPDAHGEHGGGLFEFEVEECQEPGQSDCETECEAIVECESENEWITDVNSRVERFSMQGDDDNVFFFEHAPQHQDDLHHQLASIQHELEALRHELAMLRAEMGGHGGRGGMRMERDFRRFPGQMQMREMRLPRMQFRMAPGGHGEHGMFEDIELHGLDLEGLHELHSLDLGDLHEHLGDVEGRIRLQMKDMEGGEWMVAPHGEHESRDIRIERHESSDNGAKVESRIKVIINGEVYEGDEARAKLEELGHEMPEMPEMPKMEMRMRAMPTPPTPPPAPQPNRWRRSGGEDHEDL